MVIVNLAVILDALLLWYVGKVFLLCVLRCYLFSNVKAAPSSAAGRRRRAWSESDDDEPLQRGLESSPIRENSAELHLSDGEIREDNSKLNGGAALDDEED